jgi:uncharacterized BrkB/YihY/UPF0761 family membrane protein
MTLATIAVISFFAILALVWGFEAIRRNLNQIDRWSPPPPPFSLIIWPIIGVLFLVGILFYLAMQGKL